MNEITSTFLMYGQLNIYKGHMIILGSFTIISYTTSRSSSMGKVATKLIPKNQGEEHGLLNLFDLHL